MLPNTIGPAKVAGSEIQTLLTVGRGSTRSFDHTLNAYRGCTFGCAYCYAPSFENRPEKAESWGEWVEVKGSSESLLTGVDLRGKSIFMSSVTDPYQPIEAKIELTRRIVEILSEQQAHLVVQTRSPLVARDIDLLTRFQTVKVNMSIPTHSDEIRRAYEPSAPSIDARFDTVRKLKDAGLRVSVCISPMIPVNDPSEFAEKINASGADRVTATWFHQSTRPFTANTRSLALRLNQAGEWSYEKFSTVVEHLKAHCPAFASPGQTFGPSQSDRRL